MRSVRLRLLILALTPLMVLMPLLLALAVSRWSASYDALLIANVDSDLRIAEQYLGQIPDTTGKDVEGLAGSVGFARAAGGDDAAFAAYLEERRAAMGLDFLVHLPPARAREAAARWPVIAAAGRGQGATHIDILDSDDLAAISPALAERARLPLTETRAAVPTERTAEDRGMVIHTATASPAPDRPGVLQQAIINLVVKAVQAMGGQGRLSIRTAAAMHEGQAGAALSVGDTGPGIALERLNAVFDPFYTTKPGEGTGLGLSVSQTLMRQAGGLITVRNRPQGGAEFTVWLSAGGGGDGA